MSAGRRRGVLLALISIATGSLAAADVARREAALERRMGPPVAVVTAAGDLRAGRRVRPRDAILRRVPARYAPADAALAAEEVVGLRLTADVPAGAYLTAAHVARPRGPTPVGRGERAVEVVAAGSAELVTAGARVDVLITRDDAERPGTRLALRDVEVLAAAPAETGGDGAGASRVAATLRVSLRDAVELTAAQSFAREIRLLARAPGGGA